jgi:hypothetical protein
VLVDSVVDPETNKATGLPTELVKTDKATSNSRRRKLRDVNWCHVGAATNTKTSQDATADNKTEAAITIGTKHHTGANHEDQRKEDE